MTLLRSDTYIWDTKRNTIKDFHACHTLFNIILDSHLLALFGAKYNATTCDAMLTLLEHHNWCKSIKCLSQLILDVMVVGEMMSKPEDTQDRQYENVILFIQQGMLYREFSNTIETSDTGMVENLLPFIVVYFQATKKFNYSILSIHFVTCLCKLWSSELWSY